MKTPSYRKMIANIQKGINNCNAANDFDMDKVAADGYGAIQEGLQVLQKMGIPEEAFLSRLLTGKLPKR